ncbi:MAG: SGNH/GDSL hydrolase family protein [Methylocella sp.]
MDKRLFTKLRFAALPILVGLITLMELKHPLPLFRLLTFIFVFLLLADLAFILRGKSRDLLLILASFAFGICVIEAGANALEPKSSINMTQGWSVRQPIMGWGPDRPGRFHAEKRDPTIGATIYTADYTIDSNLLRETHSIQTGPAIVFFGDSYTFGDGVSDSETMPQVLADTLEPKLRVVNLAFTGYGPQQFLREMETSRFDALIGTDPKLFIFMTAPWHAERTACKAYWTPFAPRYALVNGEVAYQGACNEGASLWLRQWLENTAAYRVFIEPYRHEVNRNDVDLYVRILEAAVRLAKDKYGVTTLIPYIRTPPEYLRASGISNEAIMDRLKNSGAAVIDVSLQAEEADGATISIKGDGHPTPLAHRLRASMLKKYIEQPLSGPLLSGLK